MQTRSNRSASASNGAGVDPLSGFAVSFGCTSSSRPRMPTGTRTASALLAALLSRRCGGTFHGSCAVPGSGAGPEPHVMSARAQTSVPTRLDPFGKGLERVYKPVTSRNEPGGSCAHRMVGPDVLATIEREQLWQQKLRHADCKAERCSCRKTHELATCMRSYPPFKAVDACDWHTDWEAQTELRQRGVAFGGLSRVY
eukprot:scaffold34000_cov69-Phaeocystis_antarctica.AAC.2